MVLSLLLDENISPSLVEPLWAQEVDTAHVNYLGMRGATDYTIWQYAMSKGRTLMTINGDDFLRFAKREIGHPGVVAIPSGGNRAEQLEYAMTAVTWAKTSNYPGSPFANQFLTISVTGDVECEATTLLTHANLNDQKFLC